MVTVSSSRVASAPHDLADRELVKRVCDGETKYFEEIVRRHQTKIFAYVYRFLNGRRDDALDVVQNTFIKAYENLKSFNRRRKFTSWLYRIAHNEAINFLKHERRRATISLDDNPAIEQSLYTENNQHDYILAREGRVMVEETLAALPPKYREALILRFIEDRTYEEMSAILQKPISTIGTLLNRGRQKFEKLLKKKTDN